MRLNDLRAAYERNELTKVEYFIRLREEHAQLANYPEFMKDTDIESITIKEDGVVFACKPYGVKLECDPGDSGIPPIVALNIRHYEKEDGAMLLRLVDDGMTFFDIGANLGWYGLHVARIFPKSRVFAFEPIPKTYSYLQRNIAHNQLSNMRAYNFGLSDQAGEHVFYVNPKIMGAASSSALNGSEGQPLECKVRRLDDVAAELDTRIDFIKADVEGAELFVFRGGINIIKECKPVIFAEMLRKHAATFHYHPNDIIKLLGEIGYKCFVCRAGKLEEFPAMDEQTVETNFVFLHPEIHARKIKETTS